MDFRRAFLAAAGLVVLAAAGFLSAFLGAIVRFGRVEECEFEQSNAKSLRRRSLRARTRGGDAGPGHSRCGVLRVVSISGGSLAVRVSPRSLANAQQFDSLFDYSTTILVPSPTPNTSSQCLAAERCGASPLHAAHSRPALPRALRTLTRTLSQGKTAKKAVSRSAKAGLQFPVGRIARFLKAGKFASRVGAGAPVYLAAVLEYLAAEVLELAGNAARDNKKTRCARLKPALDTSSPLLQHRAPPHPAGHPQRRGAVQAARQGDHRRRRRAAQHPLRPPAEEGREGVSGAQASLLKHQKPKTPGVI